MEATSLRFARAARVLGHIARQGSLRVPGFRSPPRLADADRTLRRRADGAISVSVRIRGRPWTAVVSDMVEGVVVANQLTGVEADRLRRALWAGLEAEQLLPPPPAEVPAANRRRHLALASSPRGHGAGRAA